MLMAITMKAIDCLIKQKVKENTSTLMALNTLVAGNKINKRDMVLKCGRMERDIKESI